MEMKTIPEILALCIQEGEMVEKNQNKTNILDEEARGKTLLKVWV